MTRRLTTAALQSIGAAFGYTQPVVQETVQEIIDAGTLPTNFGWEPTACIRVGGDNLLVHLLQTTELPSVVVNAAASIQAAQIANCHVVVVADSVEENTGEGVRVLRPAWAAATVAKTCNDSGIGLGFVQGARGVLRVFPPRFAIPPKCASAGEETGHIPKWLYTRVAELQSLSPHVHDAFQQFAGAYGAATRGRKVDFNTEADLLEELARNIAEGDPRLFVPIGDLEVLREFERHGAVKHARDHYFHTFNNLFMGYYILGSLKRPNEYLCSVDEFISPESKRSARLKKANEWEILWLLTCLFHDPAYIAENFHSGTFRFSYGVIEDESNFGTEIQDAQKEKIADLWLNEFKIARRWLADLYARVLRKWKARTDAPTKSVFEDGLSVAYFDGRRVSHSLVSGIRLIQHCRFDRVVQQHREPGTADTACTIAALSMMFHDLRCRESLRAAGIPPFGFSKLPYAATLMFVDCLQDDRRDITLPRFPVHGVLTDLQADGVNRTVTATVCLPEVEIKGWPGRISEYEDVLSWVNSSPEVQFTIDYKTRANIL